MTYKMKAVGLNAFVWFSVWTILHVDRGERVLTRNIRRIAVYRCHVTIRMLLLKLRSLDPMTVRVTVAYRIRLS